MEFTCISTNSFAMLRTDEQDFSLFGKSYVLTMRNETHCVFDVTHIMDYVCRLSLKYVVQTQVSVQAGNRTLYLPARISEAVLKMYVPTSYKYILIKS